MLLFAVALTLACDGQGKLTAYAAEANSEAEAIGMAYKDAQDADCTVENIVAVQAQGWIKVDAPDQADGSQAGEACGVRLTNDCTAPDTSAKP